MTVWRFRNNAIKARKGNAKNDTRPKPAANPFDEVRPLNWSGRCWQGGGR